MVTINKVDTHVSAVVNNFNFVKFNVFRVSP